MESIIDIEEPFRLMMNSTLVLLHDDLLVLDCLSKWVSESEILIEPLCVGQHSGRKLKEKN